MAICSSCSTAIQQLRPQDFGFVQRRDRKACVVLPRYRRGATPECWICDRFARWLEVEHPDVMEDWVSRSLMVEFVPFASMSSEHRYGVLLPFIMDITPSGYEFDIGDSCSVELNFLAAEDITTSSIAATKPRKSFKADISLIKNWIKECATTHEECQSNHRPWYPTRLLYIGTNGKGVKLVITKDHSPKGMYMTLSHRWSVKPHVMLESSTIVQLQNAVVTSSLPLAFQDTINIARHLGIQYLWIDSLCIIQNQEDHSDWKHESQMMDKVYSNAFLNVSATLSKDGSESLFQERYWNSIAPFAINLEVDGLLTKHFIVDGDIWSDEIENAPLNQRGWVFQERILAPRVLHFGKRQIGWECKKYVALEMFPNGLPQQIFGGFITKKTNALKTMTESSQHSGPVRDVKFVHEWHMMVSQYTKCQLSHPTDKLIAFAGIAKSIIRARNDRYLAGMWEKNLVYDLAWYRSTEDREAFPISETRSRAPSWSWASVDGEIAFPSMFGGVKSQFVEIINFSDSVPNGSSPQTCGTIRAKGLCLPLTIEWVGDLARFRVAKLWFSEDEELSASVDLECSNQEAQDFSEQGKLLLMPLFATASKLYSTILLKTRGVGAHLRIGAVEIELSKGLSQSGSELENTSQENNERRVPRTQGYRALEEQVKLKDYWDKNAVTLLHHILNGQQSYRTVYII